MLEKELITNINNETTIPKYNSKYTFKYAYGFYKFIESISKMVDEVKIEVKYNRINLKFMDASRIFLCSIKMKTTHENEITTNRNGEYHLNLEDFAKILKVLKGDKKQFTIKFTDKNLIVDKKKNGSKAIKTLEYLEDLELEDIPIENLKSIEYKNGFKIEKEYIEDMFKEVGTYSDCLTITIDNIGISFSEDGQIGNGDFRVKKEFIDEFYIEENHYDNNTTEFGTYSLTHLSLLKFLLPIMEKKQLIKFLVKTDHPIYISTDFEDLGIEFNTWIAPRVEEEDSDDDFDEF